MSGFSGEWLGLREPLDRSSRSGELVESLRHPADGNGLRRVLDLGCGTGANLRYLAPLLGGNQQWLLLDRDRALLAELPTRVAEWAAAENLTLARSEPGMLLQGVALQCGVAWRTRDLADDPGGLVGQGLWLVTASALLDLVSESWLQQLAAACRRTGAGVLFSLTYDGCVRCAPALADDALVIELVNRHQRGDKGFGPALGPTAVAVAQRLFAQHGYRVRLARSDWRIVPAQRQLQRELLRGWVDAAVEMAPRLAPRITAWGDKRQDLVDAGHSAITVGHQDLLGLPAVPAVVSVSD